MRKKPKTPWPTKDVMNQIYDMKLWGGEAFDYYSGEGSHNLEIINPYLKAIITFLKTTPTSVNSGFSEGLVVVDLGCGDFNIGKHLIKHSKKYIAVDIVEDLIIRNKKLHKADNLEFLCLDIAKDKLPKADCIILRQVLQHVSNLEIQSIIKKLTNYKPMILTEHLPIGKFTPNKDINSGQGIRLKQNSGVNLLEAPFNFKIKNQSLLNEHVLENNKGRIVTILFQVF